MRNALQKTVVMVGMMGAGKTAVGKALATRLGVRFVDSDAELVAAANMSIAEIFARDGELFFRERESEVIARLLDAAPSVLSTGGGAFLAQRNRDMISARGVSVCLKADVDLLWSRVRQKDTRPLLQTPNPRATLEDLYNARAEIYEMADVIVESRADVAIDEMALRVNTALEKRPDVLELRDA